MSDYRRIGIALSMNGQESAVIEHGLRLADELQAEAVLVHVIEELVGVPLEGATAGTTIPETPVRTQSDENPRLRALQRYAAQQCGSSLSDWRPPSAVILEGPVVESLAGMSRDLDLLVIGHHHATFIERLFNRGTDESINNRSACPLFVIPFGIDSPSNAE